MSTGFQIRSLGYRLKRLSFRRLRYAVARLWFNGLVYRMKLRRRGGRQLSFTPSEAWPGDADRGFAILRGEYSFAGETVEQPLSPVTATDVSPYWLAAFHTFDWLRDLHAVGGEPPRERGRALVAEWTEAHSRWARLTWRPDVVAARIVNWLVHADFLFATSEGRPVLDFADSIARQVRHLRSVASMVEGDAERLLVFKALIYASLCFDGEGRRLTRWVDALVAELDEQIAPDGGHISRSPAIQFKVFRYLVDIRAALRDAGAQVPQPLQNAIDRMAPMVRFFRHSDGGLCLFNASSEGQNWLIDVVLLQADARGKPMTSAPHTGFQRLSNNRTLVLMDTGGPPSPGKDSHAHAGTLSFEMSVGRERVIVNCGAYAGRKRSWRIAQRTTAAHSTVTIDDVNSSEILSGGRIGNRPRKVDVERRESEGAIWVEAQHDGYRPSLGLIHRRRLYLSSTGGDLRGEDVLTGRGSHKFAVRFHLHPAVKASLLKGGTSILLRLPGGGGWRFRASGGVISLQESIYLGASSDSRRTEQIVVSGAIHDGDATVKWAFTRVAKESEKRPSAAATAASDEIPQASAGAATSP